MRQVTEEEMLEMEGPFTYEELTAALKTMSNNKNPGTDGFTAEFFKFFWKDLGKLILRSLNESYEDEEHQQCRSKESSHAYQKETVTER